MGRRCLDRKAAGVKSPLGRLDSVMSEDSISELLIDTREQCTLLIWNASYFFSYLDRFISLAVKGSSLKDYGRKYQYSHMNRRSWSVLDGETKK